MIYAFGLVAALGAGWLYQVRFEPETRFWAAAFEERRQELGGDERRPRLIFTGDSACSFGLNPRLLEEGLGLPTYNLGGTRQMGMRIFMNEALRHARQGDTIVLIANPALLASEADEERYPKAGARMALAMSEELKLGEWVDATRPGFNHLVSLGAKIALGMPMFRYDEGDLREGGQVVTSKRDHPAATRREFEMEDRLSKAALVLQAWGESCGERGVSLCYLLPIELTDAEILARNRKKKGDFLSALEARETGVRILRTERMGCSAEGELFADTLFHFTEEGAADFSRRLLPVFQEFLEGL